jgi:phage terminase large subunit GpA-like protein
MLPTAPPRDAEALLLNAVALACRVAPPRNVAEWAEAERIVAAESGSPWPGRWKTDRLPYLRQIMEVMTLSHPARRVTFLKSAQIGGSEAALNMIGQVMAETPAPVLVMLPSIDMMRGYNRLKLDPMISASPALAARVEEVVARSGEESTATFKRFPGGYLQLLTANSSANLQMRSARVLLCEEVSDYPLDADGRGDPVRQLEARAIIYAGREKICKVSTPAEEGSCRVTAAYEASSQGKFFVPCPHCQTKQTLEWENLRWPKGQPQAAQYHCSECGTGIDPIHRPAMLAQGEWVHAKPELLTEHAGFAINALYSPTISWADLAAEFEEVKDDPEGLKTFTQQKLGRAWRIAGEAPEFQRLYDRRESWAPGTVPKGGLVLTAGIDVQRNRIELFIWAWGRLRQSWLVDHIIIAGSPFAWATWEQVAAALETIYPHEAGGALPISLSAVDSGDGTTTAEVYAFVRKVGQRRAIAVKGRDAQPQAIAPGGKVDVKRDGKRIGRLKPWLVGVSHIKGEFYGQLRLDRPTAESGEGFPPGFIHLPTHVAGEEICRQLVAEELRRSKTRQGFAKLEWIKTRDRNEALDCRVYARAAAVVVGVDRFTPERWQELAEAAAAAAPRRVSIQHALALPDDPEDGPDDTDAEPEVEPGAAHSPLAAPAPMALPPPPPPARPAFRPRAWGGGHGSAW